MTCLILVYMRSILLVCFFCFFKQKTAYEMRISDWSSDVCSSDLRASIQRLRCSSAPLAARAGSLFDQAFLRPSALYGPAQYRPSTEGRTVVRACRKSWLAPCLDRQ